METLDMDAVVQPAVSGPAVAARRRRHRIRLLAVAAIGLGLVAGWFWWHAQRRVALHYLTTPATRGAVMRAVAATGTVNPELTIIVGSYVSGVIQALQCDYNTKVKAGQICAKIDPRPYRTVVNEAQAALHIAKAQIEKDQASLAYARLNEARNRKLAVRQFASQDAADFARNQLDQAQAQIGLDQATIEQRAAELEAAQVNLDYTNIVSPVDGTVVSRNVTQGQTVAASFQTPTLFLIATDLTHVQVDTNVSESDIGSVRESNEANFTVDAFPNRVFAGKVTQLRQSPQTVQNVVTFDAVISVANKDLALMPGMTASVRVVTDRRADTLRVPNQALHYAPPGTGAPQDGTSRLFLLRDGAPAACAVTPGLEDESFTEITGGALHAGDAVIIGDDGSGRIAAAAR
jgi:HlyD family secretion protein